MSYILDALRRADADRQRETGALPGLATPLEAGWSAGDATSEGRGRRWASVAAVLACVAGAALWMVWPRAQVAPPVSALPAPPAPVLPPPMPPAAPPMLSVPTTAALPASEPMPAPVAVAPPLAREAPPNVTPAPARPLPRPKPAVRAEAAPAPARPTPLAALPPEQRQQLPRLVVGGSMYSENPSLRMVILDGQLLHEGEPVAPGVVLERVNPRSAVLRWGERRVELGW